jgi:predicted HTH transcriptional regulator
VDEENAGGQGMKTTNRKKLKETWDLLKEEVPEVWAVYSVTLHEISRREPKIIEKMKKDGLTLPEWQEHCTVRFCLEEYMSALECANGTYIDRKYAERKIVKALKDAMEWAVDEDSGRWITHVSYKNGECVVEFSTEMMAIVLGEQQ